VGHIRSFCFWFDRLNRRTGLTRHYHLRRILESISSARLATLAFASLMDSRMEFTEATLHAPTVHRLAGFNRKKGRQAPSLLIPNPFGL
jgi:hypothetical protein